MSSFRLRLVPYLGVWIALLGGQAFAYSAAAEASGIGAGILAVLLVQMFKIVPVAGRMNDLGRDPSESILVMVPFANLGLIGPVLGSTPGPSLWEKRRSKWADEVTPLGAFLLGAKRTLRILPTVLLLSALWAGAHTVIGYWLTDMIAWAGTQSSDSGKSASEVLLFSSMLLFGYTLLNYKNRHKASRASWLPSLLVLPLLLLGGAASFITEGGPIPTALAFTAWDLAWICTMDAALAVAFVVAADEFDRGGRPSFMFITGQMVKLAPSVAPSFGRAWTSIMVGLQVVIPGIHYSLQYALVAPIAVLEPEANAIARSTELSRGVRRRLFVLLYLGFFITIVTQLSIAYFVDGPDVIAQMFVMPTALSETSAFWGSFVSYLVWSATMMGLVSVYKGRALAVAARAAAKNGAEPSLTNPFKPSAE